MSSLSRSPPSGGASVAGASQDAEPQDTVEAQPTDEAVGVGGVPITGAAAGMGAATLAAAGGWSPAPEVFLLAQLVRQGARLPPPKRPTSAALWSLRSPGAPHA
jgi:hypothetical protein